jgi:cyclic pyranopterin phosphate synthase
MSLEHGFKAVKVNCVLMRGFNDDEILDFIEFTKNKDIYLRFIEYMPFDGNRNIRLILEWNDKKIMKYEEALSIIKKKYKLCKIEDAPNDTSKGYQVEGYKGKVGFITSMTDHFCGTCNRLRLTADGNLKVCLHSNEETNLRDLLRENFSEEELFKVINSAVKGKKFSHDGMYNLAERKNRPMITIGG